jgi:hypothetical protein
VHPMSVIEFRELAMALTRRKATGSYGTTCAHSNLCGSFVSYGYISDSLIGPCCTTAAAQALDTHAATAV